MTVLVFHNDNIIAPTVFTCGAKVIMTFLSHILRSSRYSLNKGIISTGITLYIVDDNIRLREYILINGASPCQHGSSAHKAITAEDPLHIFKDPEQEITYSRSKKLMKNHRLHPIGLDLANTVMNKYICLQDHAINKIKYI